VVKWGCGPSLFLITGVWAFFVGLREAHDGETKSGKHMGHVIKGVFVVL
jgi:hypothetical protein